MTFYEAALRVLEGAGHPLHFLEITEKSVAQNLLSHVGKTPEQTMLSRLAAMARRNRDRRMIVTARDTFALVEWGVPEDADALATTGVVEPNPEEDLPPLRPVERHPEPRADFMRGAGRNERRGRPEEEDDRRRRRFPPVPEVAFEILTDAAVALTPADLLAKGKERSLCGEDLSEKALLTSLLEDNQRRIDAGRRPQFAWLTDGRQLSLERSDLPVVDIQSALAAALGIPLENGRPVLRPSSAHETSESVSAAALKASVKDSRRAMARSFRKKLSELDAYTLEKAAVRMLAVQGFRDLKVAKRSNLGPLMTGRKREGSVELRCAVRLVKGQAPIDRKQVQDLRRDMGNYAAHIGLLISPGEPRGDARSEATHPGPLAMLWCGEALAEKFFESKAGVLVQTVEFFEVDERFFETAKVEAEEVARRREERQRTRGDRPERPPRPPKAEPQVSAEAFPTDDRSGVRHSTPDEGDEEEGPDGQDLDDAENGAEASAPSVEGSAPGTAAEGEQRRRRRRRRRGRRGRPDRPAVDPGGVVAVGASDKESGAEAPSSQPPSQPQEHGVGPTPSEPPTE